MKNTLKLKQKILALVVVIFLMMPVITPAQGFWDLFVSENWYSILSDNSEDPNDKDKKPSVPAPQPAPSQEPLPEQCDPSGTNPYLPRCPEIDN